ncbi:MAG: hypothetical protein OET63_10125 [Desulfobacterales bacterium]|jgi:hypothetical protein|nr:hypothetical protein [Desulfobacterales bacterium]
MEVCYAAHALRKAGIDTSGASHHIICLETEHQKIFYRATGSFHLADKVIIIAYFAAMIGIGVLLYSRMQSFDDFLVAGRRMTAPLLVCTLVSTYSSPIFLFREPCAV